MLQAAIKAAAAAHQITKDTAATACTRCSGKLSLAMVIGESA
jgi:hypothetical protein